MKILHFLRETHNQLLAAVAGLRFDKKDYFDVCMLSLYGTLIELSGCMVLLIDGDGKAGAPSILRSFLEAYVDLKNLSDDKSYLDNISASHLKEWLKVLREAEKGANPYLGTFSASPELAEEITSKEAQLGVLKSQGKNSLTFRQKFEAAGMLDEYNSMYNFLSCDSHSNLRALVGRHVAQNAVDHDLVFYKDESIDRFIPLLDTTTSLLLSAAHFIHSTYGETALPDVTRLQVELDEIRKSY